MSSLLSFINSHVGATSGAHAASAVSVSDSGGKLDATNVETALAEILTAFEAQHYRDNQFNGGQHRAIRQPDLGSGRVLLFYSAGTGGMSARFRIFADSDDVWFTMNADWNNDDDQWEKDSPGYSGGFRFGRAAFEIMHDDGGSNEFTDWECYWRLPMSLLTNSAFDTHGTIRETGRLALQATNSYSSARVVSAGVPITYRNRFPAIASSVTFSSNDVSSNWFGSPVSTDPTRDGFVAYSYQYTDSQATSWWYGTYTAIA